MRIGIVGSGNIGQGLARLAVAVGYQAALSNSRGPASLRDLAREFGAEAASVDEAVRTADLVVLAVPFQRVFDIDPTPFDGKVLLDTSNYYPARDGRIPELDGHQTTTTLLVQQHLAGARVVKAFNAIMAGDLVAPFGLPGRTRALPVAADDDTARERVEQLHARIGFDTVDAGSLAQSWRFERAKPAYCIPMVREELVAALAAAERDVELPHNSWKRST